MKTAHKELENRLGQKFKSNQGEVVQIIEYYGWNNCTIIFPNKFILKNVQYSAIVDGRVKNPYFPNLYNIGFTGFGNYKPYNNKKFSKAYISWHSMFKRCYSNEHNSYDNVVVCNDWHNFQNFAKWFYENYVVGWELDKDILIKNSNIYSPDSCCFVPKQINILFINRKNDRGNQPIGVIYNKGLYVSRISINNNRIYIGSFKNKEDAFLSYKKAKENYIKEIAIIWKGKINEKLYKAMINYKVEIND